MAEPQVSETIIRGIVVGVFAENCWIIGNRRTGEAICIDPGDQPDDVLALARDMGVAIKAIANSHAHVDHILGVRGVQSASGAKFHLHRGDLPVAAQAARSALMFTGREVEPPPDPDFFPQEGDEISHFGRRHAACRARTVASISARSSSVWAIAMWSSRSSTE